MVRNDNIPAARVWREAMGPGFVSGPGEKTLAVLAAASATDRRAQALGPFFTAKR